MRRWCIGAIAMALLVAPALAACPNKCSGHGSCGKNDVCACMQNWTGGDCSGRVCPYTRAWQDTAEADSDAHYYAECGNRGLCDRDKGVCDCDEPFAGSGCRRLGCPSDCSGHGTCEFIEELAADGYYKRVGGKLGRKYELWDQEKIMGCRCDPGFEGHNCARRVCPKGDDPLTTAVSGVDTTEMVQVIDINNFKEAQGFLTYHDPYGSAWTTDRIVFSVKTGTGTVPDPIVDTFVGCANIQKALRRLPNNVLNNVDVTEITTYTPLVRSTPTSSSGTPGTVVTFDANVNADQRICQVTFKSEPGTTGYQNLIECDVSDHDATGQRPVTSAPATVPTCKVAEHSATATRPLSELAECSNRGVCDSANGVCKCYAGHMGLACQTQEALV
jgi:hypothetical protein